MLRSHLPFLLTSLVALASACSQSLEDGETECGSEVCEAGQYCFDQATDMCAGTSPAGVR